MEFNGLFTFLYPLVPLIAFFGYIPQIYILVNSERAPQSISLHTWSLWTFTWVISFGYAVFCIQDIMFSITCAMNVIAHSSIIILKIYKDYKYMPSIAETYLHRPEASKIPAIFRPHE